MSVRWRSSASAGEAWKGAVGHGVHFLVQTAAAAARQPHRGNGGEGREEEVGAKGQLGAGALLGLQRALALAPHPHRLLLLLQRRWWLLRLLRLLLLLLQWAVARRGAG